MVMPLPILQRDRKLLPLPNKISLEGDWGFRVVATIVERTICPRHTKKAFDAASRMTSGKGPVDLRRTIASTETIRFIATLETLTNGKPIDAHPFVVRMAGVAEGVPRYSGPKRQYVETRVFCVQVEDSTGNGQPVCRFPRGNLPFSQT